MPTSAREVCKTGVSSHLRAVEARFSCAKLCLFAFCLQAGLLTAAPQPDLATFQQQVQPFLQKYCVECHGPSEQKAGVRLDQIGPMTADFAFGDIWREVQDQVLLEEMPPRKKEQPASSERLAFLDWVNKEIHRAETAFASTGGKVVLRRLNKREYANSVRDLLYLNPFIDPKSAIPDDDSFHGFDNIGMALNISPVQMGAYMESAQRMLDIAFTPQNPPAPTTLRIQPADLADWYAEGRRLAALKATTQLNRKDLSPAERKKLEGEVTAAGVEHRRQQDLTKILTFASSDDLKFPGDGVTFSSSAGIQTGQFKPGIYKVRVTARGNPNQTGEMPLLTVEARSELDSQELLITDLSSAAKTYESEALIRPGIRSINIGCKSMGTRFHYKKGVTQPTATLITFEIEGPLPDPYREQAQQTYFAHTPETDEGARALLAAFAERAFRRPPDPARLQQFIDYYQSRRQAGVAFRPAVIAVMQGIMASPEFLFMIENKNGADERKQPLDAFDLATRLSYFLTSGPPDAPLYADAKAGKLNSPEALLAHARRLIQSPAAQSFAENFTGQWLKLRTLGDMAPDNKKYTDWEPTLQDSMRKETEQFFLYVLQKGLPITNFLHTNFTLLNSRLAHFYGIPGVEGYEFRPVSLKPDDVRGGLLTHASILTLTSDGIRTSPVKRGTFLLENIFGDPPPPPPNNVPPVKETKGATLRERLASHREEPACASCHAKIDPLGFALENFNAIGKWREKEEDSGLPVDPSGKMPAGGDFKTFVEFRELLARRGDDVARCLTEKLLMYALGRPVEFNDQPALRKILEKTKADQYKLNTLVEAIVVSEPFLTK